MPSIHEYVSGVMECVRGFRPEGWPRVEKPRPVGRPELLDEFREMNPHLIEVSGNEGCVTHWDLLPPSTVTGWDTATTGGATRDGNTCSSTSKVTTESAGRLPPRAW